MNNIMITTELADLRQTYYNRLEQNRKLRKILDMREKNIDHREITHEYYVARIAELENELEEARCALAEVINNNKQRR